jgi:oligoribonuclease NrnB/cAMP/cGMP phosphodiesterase (DHH superfamily)
MKDVEYFERLGELGIFTCILDHHVWADEVTSALQKNKHVSYAHCPLLERNMNHLLMQRSLPSDRLVSTAELVSHLVVWNKAIPSETRLLQQFMRHVSDYDTFSFREPDTKAFHHGVTPAVEYSYNAVSIPGVIEFMQAYDEDEHRILIQYGYDLEEEFNKEVRRKIAEVQICTDKRFSQQLASLV